MVHAQKIEESKFKGNNTKVKRARTGDENFSNTKTMDKVGQGSNKGFPTKDPLVLQGQQI